MNARRCDPEEPDHVSLRRRASVHQGVGVNERQILALSRRENWSRISGSIPRVPPPRELAMNITYRGELRAAERTELATLLNGGNHAARKIKRAQILLAADAGVIDEVIANSLSVSGSTVYG